MEESKKIMVESKRMIMREVNSTDSDFIYDLRKERGEFMNNSSFTRESNLEWVKNYESTDDDTHFYFIALDRKGERLGIGRIHDIDYNESSFTWGSWLVTNHAHFTTSIIGFLLVGNFAFNSLNLKIGFADTRNENSKSKSTLQSCGMKLIKKDELKHYYKYTKEDFNAFFEKYSRLL